MAVRRQRSLSPVVIEKLLQGIAENKCDDEKESNDENGMDYKIPQNTEPNNSSSDSEESMYNQSSCIITHQTKIFRSSEFTQQIVRHQ